MRFLVELAGGGGRWRVEVAQDRVTVNGTEHRAELRAFDRSPQQVLILNGKSLPLVLEPGPDRGTWIVTAGGERHEVLVLDERIERARRAAGPEGAGGRSYGGTPELKAPMPGMVVRVLVEPGQEVGAGASLVVLEAMKMENELRAAAPGVVDRVLVRPGETVEKGALLVAFRA